MRRTLVGLVAGLALGCAAPAGFAQGAASCIVAQLGIEIGVGMPGVPCGIDNLVIKVHFADGTYSASLNANQSLPWQAHTAHTITFQLSPPRLLNEIKSIELFYMGTERGRSLSIGTVQVRAIGDNTSEPIFVHARPIAVSGPFVVSHQSEVITADPAAVPGCSSASRRSFGAVRSGQLLSNAGGNGTGSGIGSLSNEGRNGSGSGGQVRSGGTGDGSHPSSLSAAATPITNSDVIKMVQAGLPGAAIIASIRSHAGAFDLSNKARSDLLAARGKDHACEMTGIWNAMIAKATNGRGGDDDDESCPQPNPPKNAPAAPAPGSQPSSPSVGGNSSLTGGQKTLLGTQANSPRDGGKSGLIPAVRQPALSRGNPGDANRPSSTAGRSSAAPSGGSNTGARGGAPVATAKLKIGLGAPKIGPQVKNPGRSQVDSVIIAALQKQRQMADVEAPSMSVPAVRSQSRAATGGDGGRTSQPAVQPQSRRTINGGTKSGLNTGPSQTSSAPGNTSSSATHLLNMDMTALTCTHDPAFRILTVSGSSFPATFTPIDQYNRYTIRGCSFGEQPPTNSTVPTDYVHIYGGTGTFYGKFVIRFWSDSEIDVSLDPALSGFPDADNLNLVVKRADGQETQKGRFKFYADRETVPLATVAQPHVTADPQQLHFSVNYTAPAADLGGYSAEFARYVNFHEDRPSGTIYLGDQNLGKNPDNSAGFFNVPFASATGSDYFDFSRLAPGFNTESYQLATWQPSASICPGNADNLQSLADGKSIPNTTDGYWNAECDGNNIRVVWRATDCQELELFQAILVRESQYALQVYVNGPRCLDPWTGQPDQTCIKKVKEEFGEQ